MNEIKTIINRDGTSKGKMTSYGHHCRMAGCTGRRFSVKWEDGKRTFPCSKGLEVIDDRTAKIM